MARKDIGIPLDRKNRNNHNENYKELYNDFRNVVQKVSDEVFDKVVDNARLDWDKMVDKYSDLPSNAEKGTTIGVKEEGVVYRFNGSDWDSIYEINLNPISEVDERLTTQLADIAINVKVFGAVADANYFDEDNKKYYVDKDMAQESTDNKSAFQDAVDYANSIGGGTVFVPRGEYMLRSEIEWKTGVSLKGDGTDASILYAQGRQFSLIDYRPGTAPGENTGDLADDSNIWLYDCHFKDFQIDMKGLSDTHSTVEGKAMFMLYMSRCSFRELILKNSIGTALGCDFLDETVIDSVKVYNAGRNWGVPRESDDRIVKVGQSGIGIGTAALESESVVISNCHVYNCGNYGIFVETQQRYDRPQSKHAKIINCHVEGNRYGLGNRGSGPVIFNACTVYNNKHGIKLQRNSYGDIISSCIIENSEGEGIFVDKSYDGELSLLNNVIKCNGYRGIFIDADSSYDHVSKVFNIIGNIINDNGYHGIDFGTTTDNNLTENVSIKNNTIYNNCQETGSVGMRMRNIFFLDVVGNSVFDNQDNKTQLRAIAIGESVENFFIDGNNFTKENDSVKMLYSTNGYIGDNIGIGNKVNGMSSIDNGESEVWVNHFIRNLSNYDRPDVSIIITPKSNESIWVANEEPNRFKVKRKNDDGKLDFYWEISLIQ